MKAIQKNAVPPDFQELYNLVYDLSNKAYPITIDPFENYVKQTKWEKPCGKEVNIKAIVQKSLLEEQGYICCYCNSKINETNLKIEHYKPRETYNGEVADASKESKLCSSSKGQRLPDLRMNYSNLLAACDSDKIHKGTSCKGKDAKHCDDGGHFGKANWELCKIQNPSAVSIGGEKQAYDIEYDTTEAIIYSNIKHQLPTSKGLNICACKIENTKNKCQCLNWELGGCMSKTEGYVCEAGRLNLNAKALRDARKTEFNIILKEIVFELEDKGHVNNSNTILDFLSENADISKIEIQNKITVLQKKDNKGHFNPYCEYLIYALNELYNTL